MDAFDIIAALLDALPPERHSNLNDYKIEQIADLMVSIVTPEAIEEWLATPAPAYEGRSILECVRADDLDTPLGALAALAEGAVI